METEVIKIIRLGLEALSERVFALVSLICSFALFAWVMEYPSWIRFSTAVAFSIIIFVPLMRKAVKHEN